MQNCQNCNKEDTKVIPVTVSYSFSFEVPLEIPNTKEINLKELYCNQYPSIEELFTFLDKYSYLGKKISENFTIDDFNIDII